MHSKNKKNVYTFYLFKHIFIEFNYKVKNLYVIDHKFMMILI